MYIQRHMERVVKDISKMFGSVLVTGPRQVGKTTLLNKVTDGTAAYVSLDDPLVLRTAKEDAGSFFKIYKPPVFVDEIQYAPSLFPFIKMDIDAGHKKGRYFMSGSHQFHLMKGVSESLAGRVGILELHGLSLREINGVDFRVPFIPTKDYVDTRRGSAVQNSYDEIWNMIHRGGMPELTANPDFGWQEFYAAYTKSYIERDIRDLTQIGDEMKFLRFMTVAASRTGQLLNMTSLARDVGISVTTAERWLSLLQTSNIIYLLQPYFNNITKRAVKTPKLYFMDTGLAAYLTGWNTAEVLQKGAMAGEFFETFVITEIIKSYCNAGGLHSQLYFYRDKEQNEIDLLISQNMTLYPIEIKKHSNPGKEDTAAFCILDGLSGLSRGDGCVISMYENLLPLSERDLAIPLSYI